MNESPGRGRGYSFTTPIVMQEKNERRLHAWATEALAERDYETVREILAMLEATSSPSPIPAIPTHPVIAPQQKPTELRLLSAVEPALPARLPQFELPSSTRFRDVHAWVDVVKHGFLVELVNKGRTTFVTDDVMRWIDDNVPLTAGDLEEKTNGTRWRNQVSNAVRKLRDAGVIFQRGEGCRTYSIVKVRQPAQLEQSLPEASAFPCDERIALQTSSFPAPIESRPSAPFPFLLDRHRSYRVWEQLIKEKFLAELAAKNNHTFTASQIMEWAETSIALTRADKELIATGPRWRKQISVAINSLKRDKLIYQMGEGTQTYSILPPSARIDVDINAV